MTTNAYAPTTAHTPYYRSLTERAPARLWSVEKATHDMGGVGMIQFFEGPAPDPTVLSGYATTKLWLKQTAGVQTVGGTVHYWNGTSPASNQANWPALTPDGFLYHLTRDFGGLTGAQLLALVIGAPTAADDILGLLFATGRLRDKQLGALSLYCNVTGSDTTGDGTSGNPWRQPQKALDYITANIDLGGLGIVIQLVGPGVFDPVFTAHPWVGKTYNTIVGNISDPASIVIESNTPGIACVGTRDGAILGISGIRLQSPVGNPLVVATQFSVIDVDHCDFGISPAGTWLSVSEQGAIGFGSGNRCVGDAAVAISAAGGGRINVFDFSIPSALTLSYFITSTTLGKVTTPNAISITGAGVAGTTGVRYLRDNLSFVSTLQTWPGNASAVVVGGPAFGAFRSGNQTITTATATKVAMNAKDFDAGAFFDATTNYRFTPTVPGKYVVTFNVEYASIADASIFRALIYKNGSLLKRFGSVAAATTTHGVGGSVVVDMDDNDYLEFYTYQAQGSDATLQGGADATFCSAAPMF